MKHTYIVILVLIASCFAGSAQAQTLTSSHRSPYVTNQVPGLKYSPEVAKKKAEQPVGNVSESVNAQLKKGTFGGGKVATGSVGSSGAATKKATSSKAVLASDSLAKKDSVKAKPAAFAVPSQGDEKTSAPKH